MLSLNNNHLGLLYNNQNIDKLISHLLYGNMINYYYMKNNDYLLYYLEHKFYIWKSFSQFGNVIGCSIGGIIVSNYDFELWIFLIYNVL